MAFADEEMGEAQPQRQGQRKTKGRGFRDQEPVDLDDDRAGPYETYSDSNKGPVKCRVILQELCGSNLSLGEC